MSYNKLCDDLLHLTNQIVAVFVEHRDGYRVAEKIRNEIIKIDEDRLLLGLFRGAQLVERAKEYKKEVGNIHVIVHEFDSLTSFIFPLKDNHALIVGVGPDMKEFKSFINDVREIIEKNGMHI